MADTRLAVVLALVDWSAVAPTEFPTAVPRSSEVYHPASTVPKHYRPAQVRLGSADMVHSRHQPIVKLDRPANG